MHDVGRRWEQIFGMVAHDIPVVSLATRAGPLPQEQWAAATVTRMTHFLTLVLAALQRLAAHAGALEVAGMTEGGALLNPAGTAVGTHLQQERAVLHGGAHFRE
jgi:hypothetical protein